MKSSSTDLIKAALQHHTGKVLRLPDTGEQSHIVTKVLFHYMPKAVSESDALNAHFTIDAVVKLQLYHYPTDLGRKKTKADRIFQPDAAWLGIYFNEPDDIEYDDNHKILITDPTWHIFSDFEIPCISMFPARVHTENDAIRYLSGSISDRAWIYRGDFIPYYTQADKLIPYPLCSGGCGEYLHPRYSTLCWNCKEKQRPICPDCGQRFNGEYRTCYNCHQANKLRAPLLARIRELEKEIEKAKKVRTPDGDFQEESNVAELEALLKEMDALTTKKE